MGDVVKFTGLTKLDLKVSDVIDGARDHDLEDCIIMGTDKNGEPYLASSTGNLAEVLLEIELHKAHLIRLAEECQ